MSRRKKHKLRPPPKQPWQVLSESQWSKAADYIFVSVIDGGEVMYDRRLKLILEEDTIRALVRLAYDALRYDQGRLEEVIDWEMVRADYDHEIGRGS